MLTDELADLGYDVGEVEITVGTSYEAVGEALSAGTADVGLIPGGTYVLYDDGCDVLLTATRDGLSIDSDSAKDWNDNAPTEATTEQVTSYRALMIAGPSEKGKELAAKVNAGEDLTWEDVSSANWSVEFLFPRGLHLSLPVAAGEVRQKYHRPAPRRTVRFLRQRLRPSGLRSGGRALHLRRRPPRLCRQMDQRVCDDEQHLGGYCRHRRDPRHLQRHHQRQQDISHHGR